MTRLSVGRHRGTDPEAALGVDLPMAAN
jgi:hypothetical protein